MVLTAYNKFVVGKFSLAMLTTYKGKYVNRVSDLFNVTK